LGNIPPPIFLPPGGGGLRRGGNLPQRYSSAGARPPLLMKAATLRLRKERGNAKSFMVVAGFSLRKSRNLQVA